MSNTVEYFETICSGIDAATTAMNERVEPFCIIGLIYKNSNPYDIVMLGCNKAFHRLVNKNVAIGQSIRSLSVKTVEFWLNALIIVELTSTKVTVKNYEASNGRVVFGRVTAIPIQLLGKTAIGLVLEEPRFVESKSTDLCLKCPNNELSVNPTIKLKKLALKVDGSVEVNSCAVCLKLREFLNGDFRLG